MSDVWILRFGFQETSVPSTAKRFFSIVLCSGFAWSGEALLDLIEAKGSNDLKYCFYIKRESNDF